MLKTKIKNTPGQPGIYMMKDKDGAVIYIGKAKNLKNRISSYFAEGRPHDPKTETMLSRVTDLSYIITNTETEALILEAGLVKKHRPHYNIELKDDKAFPYLTLTVSDLYPRLIISRRHLSKNDLHFGPYTTSITHLISILRKTFRIRDCKPKTLPKKICLSYHIKRCLAPCEGHITHKQYMENIRQTRRFLTGNIKEVTQEIEKNMKTAAQKHKFESAALYRDQLHQLTSLIEKQAIVSPKKRDIDIIGLCPEEEKAAFNILLIRNGAVTGTRHYITDMQLGPEETLESFIKQYYFSHSEFIPKDIIVPLSFDEKDLIAEWLSGLKRKKVRITIPKRGERLKLLEISNKNAREAYLQDIAKQKDEKEKLRTLKKSLGLEKIPRTIEAFDISTIGGKHSVGSMVQFLDGRPNKKNYRRFRIKTVEGLDDFSMMREVLTRRYARIKNEDSPMPDLVL
ncbi:MAG: excinuclease ABC subunit UvrC, partial [archaeon]|nr:excinuclease ABC subunit UvrC [archaeon]